MRKWLSSALLRQLLFALLAVSLIPLGIIAWYSITSYFAARDEVVGQSRDALNAKSFEGLAGRTYAIAEGVADFLRERERDAHTAATLDHTPEAYLAFAQSRPAVIWTINPAGDEVKFEMPLYRELAFIDTTGQERVKVVNTCTDYPFTCQMQVSDDLRNVSDPANTLLKSETYFSDALALGNGELYIGPALGEYVPYEKAYAGTQRRDGQRYRGLLRFAIPVTDQDGQRSGVVVLTVETLHLLELTAHVAPASPAPLVEIDPRETDFAYLVDRDGWAIAHPRHYNITGVDENGKRVPAMSEANRADPNNLFRPGNLNQMAFIDAIFPQLMASNARGEANIVNAAPLGRQERILSYVTIPYYGGQYNTPAGFGLVVLSTDGARFTLEADLLGKQIGNRITDLIGGMQWLAFATLVVGFVTALILAQGIAFPILNLTDAAKDIEGGDWATTRIDPLTERKGSDEVSTLSRVFASMAKEVRARELALKQRVQELEIVLEHSKVAEKVSEITDSEFFRDLTRKAKKLRAERAKRDRSAEKRKAK
jgi:HAMP domain-containing protein